MRECLDVDANFASAHEGIPVFWLKPARLLTCLEVPGTVPWAKTVQSVSAPFLEPNEISPCQYCSLNQSPEGLRCGKALVSNSVGLGIKFMTVTDSLCWLSLQCYWKLPQNDSFLPSKIRIELTCSNSVSSHRIFNTAPAKTILEKQWMEVNCDYLETHRKHSKYAVLKDDQVTETV